MSQHRKWIDIILLILFAGSMSSTFIAGTWHGIIGALFLIAVLMHNCANRQFYQHLNKQRSINLVTTILLGLSVVLLIVSGTIIFFPTIKFAENWNWRSIHLGLAICSLILLMVHLLIHSRRYIRKKLFYVMAVISFVLAIGGIFGLPYLDRWYHQVEVDKAAVILGDKVQVNGKVLTVYFSRVGNTNFTDDVDAVSGASVMKDHNEIIGNAQMIALMVQNATDSDILEIKTTKSYPSSYSDTTKAAKEEISNDELPTLKPADINVDEYNTIILIYPLWWSTLPKAVESFLKVHDMMGKTMAVIVTHGGGGIGNSLSAIKKSTNANVIDDYLDVYSSDIPSARKDISDFLKRVLK